MLSVCRYTYRTYRGLELTRHSSHALPVRFYDPLILLFCSISIAVDILGFL